MGFALSFLIKIGVYATALYAAGQFVPGFTVSSDWRILLSAGFFLTLGYTVLRPVLKIITFPIALITFGLSNTIINAGILWGVAQIVPGLTIDGIIPLVWGSAVIGIASILFVFI